MYHVGMYGAVAPLGTSLSEDQLLLMWKYCDEPIVCMDGDNAGYKSAVRTLNMAIPILKPGKSLKFTFLPEGKDPDNLISDGKKDLLEQKIKIIFRRILLQQIKVDYLKMFIKRLRKD